ncbi:hypothetical protein IQ257_26935 [Coleofasciculus sp. LEGE 07092]|nr:hypothetical protein [Coleofasciculus sp. LEGE 07081]MBE9152054.1 hypothetical protein [Coleofasciculus sp. LEGE 07092]
MPVKPQRQKVERLHPSRQLIPAWLKVFVVLQRGSDWLTFFLIATTLTIYSWTVYTQQQWALEYRKLETLQRDERQLTTTNEVIKDQLAQQAERPATGLVNPSTANTILLSPAPERQLKTPSTQIPHSEAVATTPLGY